MQSVATHAVDACRQNDFSRNVGNDLIAAERFLQNFSFLIDKEGARQRLYALIKRDLRGIFAAEYAVIGDKSGFIHRRRKFLCGFGIVLVRADALQIFKSRRIIGSRCHSFKGCNRFGKPAARRIEKHVPFPDHAAHAELSDGRTLCQA